MAKWRWESGKVRSVSGSIGTGAEMCKKCVSRTEGSCGGNGAEKAKVVKMNVG